MTDASGQTSYTYDSLDRLTSKVTPAQGTLSYTYDAAGNVASVKSSNANGVWASYTYDDMGRLGTVVDGRLSGQNTTTYTYDPSSNLATAACPLPAVKLPARMAPRTGWVAHVWIFRHGRPWLWAVLFPSTLV
jgi:YD repeat-containing protein